MTPYVDVSASFDVNWVIRDAYRRALAADRENKIASALKAIADGLRQELVAENSPIKLGTISPGGTR